MNTPSLIALSTLLLSACGSITQPIVKNGDLIDHLETKGYSKILIRQQISCGKAGNGRIFVATKADKVVTGQICYLKTENGPVYAVDERKFN
jgi:hypothetical protein